MFFAVMICNASADVRKNCTIYINTLNTYLYLYYKTQVKYYDYSRYIIYKNTMQHGGYVYI